ncbi:LytR/AlgR family response regulator transcription factor [Parapedobacter indicus]|uniref:Two component transcriptional regulator, LytTR family n=1 Tax=Parapedobacter indicus TaxID=1477437 RepID=A0A1I3TJM6_9SPHI|nr:LytTR family DNA-binding domain-containing protein [Parapedobacter indicus]PPK99501.1 LytTR family two component transcriptional regulator [Parapedobacter indicus]SFJ69831.1 two component transcriptional regulator, LytTR family [Parapedobacter indicus]
MPVLKTYILDDDPRAVKRSRKLVDSRKDLVLVGTATDPQKALDDIVKYRPELIILDLEMQPMDGWQVMEKLDPAIRVVICTVETTAGPKSYKFRATYYLSKPYSKADFDQAIDCVWKSVDTNDLWPLPVHRSDIWFTSGGRKRKVRLYLDDVEAVVADGNNSKVFYSHGVMMIDQSLKEVERMLPAHRFMRIHKSHIIALDRYLEHDNDNVRLQHVENKEIERLKIGERYAERFYDYLDGK